MKVTAIQHFVGIQEGAVQEGQVLEMSEDRYRELSGSGVVAPYETKVEPAPEETKKKGRSRSSRVGRQQTKKTPRKRSPKQKS
jgi:hypothetical protein